MTEQKKIIVKAISKEDDFLEVRNHPDGIKFILREEFFKELAIESSKGKIKKVLDDSMLKKFIRAIINEPIVNNVFIYNDKRPTKILGNKNNFRKEELDQLSNMKSLVRNLKIEKIVKKSILVTGVSATLLTGGAYYVNNNEAAKQKLDEISYNVSVNVEEFFRAGDLFDKIMADVYFDRGNQIVDPYDSIVFPSEKEKREFIDETNSRYVENIDKSKIKPILENNKEDEIMNKYYELLGVAQTKYNDVNGVSNYVFNNLTKEERVALSEYKSVFLETFYDLKEEKGYETRGITK